MRIFLISKLGWNDAICRNTICWLCRKWHHLCQKETFGLLETLGNKVSILQILV